MDFVIIGIPIVILTYLVVRKIKKESKGDSCCK